MQASQTSPAVEAAQQTALSGIGISEELSDCSCPAKFYNWYNQAMITRGDTLAAAIHLLCELGAAATQTRKGTTAQQPPGATGPVCKHNLPTIRWEEWTLTLINVDN